jgi:hypothetical protein
LLEIAVFGSNLRRSDDRFAPLGQRFVLTFEGWFGAVMITGEQLQIAGGLAPGPAFE